MASHELDRSSYTVAVLDIAMPYVNGLEVLKKLRLQNKKTPVLVLTARDNNRDIADALDAGADDYVIKPVDLIVLAARLRALARRASNNEDSTSVKYGDLVINNSTREVYYNNNSINLSCREFDLLYVLVQANGRVLKRHYLEEKIYIRGQEIESNAVEVHIHNLRKKINKDIIQTVRGVGYQIK
jgi:two-component system OmpR family response regulator/two-component system response regulator QseB